MTRAYFRCAFLLVVFGILRANAAVSLPALISDHMVLEQGIPVRIWGKANPAERVSVQMAGLNASAAADSAGNWELYLQPLKSGGPYELVVSGENTLRVKDVLVGEVWVASGQSNMFFQVERGKDAAAEIAAAGNPSMRLFQVEQKVAGAPADDTRGEWKICSPDSVAKFSAVAYYFGRSLYRERKVPVGLIHASWGGTPAQSWVSEAVLENDAALHVYLDSWTKVLANYPANREKYEQRLEEWKKAVAQAREQQKTPPPRPPEPHGPGHPWTPAGLYNGMIAPLIRYGIAGVIWYQGESNTPEASLYRHLFGSLIENWWADWRQGPFPFLFVQLANYARTTERQNWPLLREQQLKTLHLRHTGMAVIIDIGDSQDIHPKDKQTVGRRLALAARAIAYGEAVEYSGPVYREMTVEGGRARLWFDHIAAGLAVRGNGPLTGFEIAGNDHVFRPAEAKIERGTIAVTSPDVVQPAAVRYAWADDPRCNLINASGLPASPFRTDNWPLEPHRAQ